VVLSSNKQCSSDDNDDDDSGGSSMDSAECTHREKMFCEYIEALNKQVEAADKRKDLRRQ